MAAETNPSLTHSIGVPVRHKPQDYYSVLAGVINQTRTDSAQLRSMVYELARFNLKREALFGYPPMSIQDLAHHMDELENAIAKVEAASSDGGEHLPLTQPALPLAAEPRADASGKAVVIMPGELLPPIYDGPIPASAPTAAARRERGPRLRAALQLVGIGAIGFAAIAAVIIGVGLATGVSGQLHFGKPLAATAQATRALPDKTKGGQPDTPAAAAVAPTAPPLPYPIPAAYGVYALSDNKLSELSALPLRVPDPRVLLSPEITKPSATTLSGNKAAFIIFRRELLANAPEKVSLRVVAKVVREMKFVQGKPVINALEDNWRIRANAYELKVSPVPGHNEMVIAQGPDDFTLSPGRYALVLNGIGYDFTVPGAKLSSTHCLERFETTTGDNYTECRTP